MHTPHLCIITESWLSKRKIPPKFNDYYVAARSDRQDTENGRGGGVLILCHKSIRVSKTDVPNTIPSSQICAVQYKGLKIYGIYHSPTSTCNADYDSTFYDDISEINGDAVLIGDLNSPKSFASDLSVASKTRFNTFVRNLQLHQFVEHATHEKGSILDVVLATDKRLVKPNPMVIPTDISDHHAILCEVNLPVREVAVPISVTRPHLLNYEDIEDEVAFQLSVLPDEILTNEAADEYSDHFHDVLSSTINRHLENTRTTIMSQPNQPYITGEIRRLRNANKRLLKKALRINTDAIWQTYRSHYAFLCKKVSRAQYRYECNLVRNFRTKPSKLYNYINSKSKDNTPVGPFVIDGQTIDDVPGMAEALANNYDSASTPFAPYKGDFLPTSQVSMPEIEISSRKIRKAIFSFADSKSAGRDGIGPKIYKKLHKTLIPYLKVLIQYSYDNGFIFSHWHDVLIAPLYKPGKPRNQPQSYRPVALMQLSLKICEKVLMSDWIEFMDTNNLMNRAQHAAKKHSGTLTNLTEYLDFVTKSVDSMNQTEVLGFDMSLAFDRARYCDIIAGVLNHGMSTKCAKWLYNFLTQRRVAVRLGSHISRSFTPTSGTSQGSIAASHYFCCIMASLSSVLKSQYYIYCDDLRIVAPCSNIFEKESVQQDLHDLEVWADHHAFSINPLKSFNITFGKQFTPHTFCFKGKVIPKLEVSKDLGLKISSKLDFREQLEDCIDSVRQKCQLARKTFSMSTKLRCLVWQKYIMAKLQYGMSIIPIRSEHVKKSLIRLQYNFFKPVHFTENCPRPQPILAKLAQMRMSYVWKIINEKTNVDSTIFSVYHHKRLGKNRLRLPKCKTAIRRNFFAVEAVSEWNDLSEDTRNAKSMYTFKKSIQDDLSRKYGELNVASGARSSLQHHGPCRLNALGNDLYATSNTSSAFEGPQPVF